MEKTMRRHLLGACALIFATLPLGAAAAPMTMALTPGNMLAQTHSRGMFLPVTGTFRQFAGTLDYDPVTQQCHFDVTFVVTSLALPNALIRSQTMSPGFLDPEQYPTQHYSGTCQGNTLVGQLTMRGQTHEFDMAITYEMTAGVMTGVHLEGSLNRYTWGVDGLSLMVGKMIRITNDISLTGQAPVPLGS
jgi:polyisoprenoid-binding protein YceI